LKVGRLVYELEPDDINAVQQIGPPIESIAVRPVKRYRLAIRIVITAAKLNDAIRDIGQLALNVSLRITTTASRFDHLCGLDCMQKQLQHLLRPFALFREFDFPPDPLTGGSVTGFKTLVIDAEKLARAVRATLSDVKSTTTLRVTNAIIDLTTRTRLAQVVAGTHSGRDFIDESDRSAIEGAMIHGDIDAGALRHTGRCELRKHLTDAEEPTVLADLREKRTRQSDHGVIHRPRTIHAERSSDHGTFEEPTARDVELSTLRLLLHRTRVPLENV
jgi:hypothetical protein